jgi:carbamoyltransferase
MTPFMTTTCQVRQPDALPAVTHVDGSARVQTVSSTPTRSEPLLEVLKELERQGRPPVVLNTSFNRAGEPIVNSAEDVLASFAGSQLDALFVDDLIIRRPGEAT